jgi:hypothetical protein
MQTHPRRSGFFMRLEGCGFGDWHYLGADRERRESFFFDRHARPHN